MVRFLERRGPLLAAGVAALAALPGLGLPFLSDDWHLIEATTSEPFPAAAYDYFRPLYVATFWLDQGLWGRSPALFHLTNLLLIAASAALVVTLVRRYTGDPSLAAGTGLLFAIHPSHVENAAWIAVRGDPLYSIFVIPAALAYDRWRERMLGIPILAMVLFEASLLAKESAAILPVFLVLLGLLDTRRRATAREWLRGHMSMIGVALIHVIVLRPLALGSGARTLAPGSPSAWAKHAAGLAVSAIVPADVETVASRPFAWGGAAALALLGLLGVARVRSGKVPTRALAAAIAFGVLLLPSVVGLQDRYLFLPAAASSLALASLIGSLRGGVATAAAGVLAAAWILGCGAQWSNWRQAAFASQRLVAGLVEACRRPGVGEIVVANLPFRVRHGSVAGDFRAALIVSGERSVPVRFVVEIDYPDATADGLDGPVAATVRRPPPDAEVRVRITEGRYSRYRWPRPPRGGGSIDTGAGVVSFDGLGGAVIRIAPDPEKGRAAYAWVAGKLEPLF